MILTIYDNIIVILSEDNITMDNNNTNLIDSIGSINYTVNYIT